LPAQVAPQSASASAQDAPGLAVPQATTPSIPVPADQLRQFTQGVAERLRNAASAGENEATVLQAIATERTALANVLDGHDFRHAFAVAYQHAHNDANPNHAKSLNACHAATDNIIGHRISDARLLAQLVTQPEFIAAARAQALLPALPENNQLSPEKTAEMIAQFSQADAVIHAQMAMQGYHDDHLVLAQVFTPDGPLVSILSQKLAEQMPGAPAETTTRLAADWLLARQKPAFATAQALAEGGAIYAPVMQQLSRATPASAHAHGAPQTQGFAARILEQKQAANDLQMDRI